MAEKFTARAKAQVSQGRCLPRGIPTLLRPPIYSAETWKEQLHGPLSRRFLFLPLRPKTARSFFTIGTHKRRSPIAGSSFRLFARAARKAGGSAGTSRTLWRIRRKPTVLERREFIR